MEQNEKDLEFMLQVKEAYESSGEGSESSIRAVATSLNLSRTKVRKILVTLGVIKSEITEQAKQLKEQGLTVEEIADEMGLSMATVSTYLPYDTVIYNGEEKSANALNIERYRERLKNSAESQVYHANKTITYEEQNMKERKYKIYKLHLELNMDGGDMAVLRKYGKVKDGISRDILVRSDMTLHALHYVIQRAFGWQNSHLHHFELPYDIFERLTDNSFKAWTDYCGLYFRFPGADMEDLYWDDDYDGDVSVKTWLRRKYTAPYQYHGFSEHFMEARYALIEFINENREIRLTPPFHEWMNMREEERKIPRIKHIEDVTCDEMKFFFEESSINELLERLTMEEIFEKDEIQSVPQNFVKERHAEYVVNMEEFIRLHNAILEDDYLSEYTYCQKMNELNGKVPPVTKSLLYQYDYGDGWEVDIRVDDIYDEIPENIAGELAACVRAVFSGNRPMCIASDGLPVLDDVGGMRGYSEMLLGLHGKGSDPYDDADDTRTWASGMGWTGRMSKPEKLL